MNPPQPDQPPYMTSIIGSPTYLRMRQELSILYGDPNRRWSYYEESMLCDIAKHPTALKELEMIAEYRIGLPPYKVMYFPQSLSRLLGLWPDLLDRARMAKMAPAEPPKPVVSPTTRKKAILELLANHPCNPDSTAYDEDAGKETRQEYRLLKQKLRTINLEISGI